MATDVTRRRVSQAVSDKLYIDEEGHGRDEFAKPFDVVLGA
jgi:hypothetical protein